MVTETFTILRLNNKAATEKLIDNTRNTDNPFFYHYVHIISSVNKNEHHKNTEAYHPIEFH